MRLFIAWPLPESVAAAVREAVATLSSELPDASWTRSHLHLTFAFLGETDDATSHRLTETIQTLSDTTELDVELSSTGAFPDARRPRVLWLGLEPRDGISELARRVRRAASDAGAGFDAKRFVAHVTLARMRSRWTTADVERARASLEPLSGTSMLLNEVVLYRSHPGPSGARHEALVTARLATRPG